MAYTALVPAIYYNVKQYGALGDGSTDDTTAIANARSAANTAGGGIVFYPGGTYISGNQTLYSNVIDMGAGIGVSIVKLKNGANADLFSANTANINLSGATGTGSATGTNFWGFRDITLDGNKANQTAGPSYPIRAYGYGHQFEHVEVRSGYTGGILLDWNNTANPTAPGDAFMPRWYDVMVHDCGGMCIEVGGPTDMQWVDVNGFASGSHVVHVAPNCIALRMMHCHFWATPTGSTSVTLLNEAPELVLSSCQIEGSDTCALVLLANDCQASNLEVGSTADVTRVGRGIQLGQIAGQTPYTSQVYQSAGVTTAATANICFISGKAYACNAGALDERNTSSNIYILNCYQTSGNAVYGGGYLGASSTAMIKVTGLTLDGSPGTGGTFQVNASSYNGVKVFGQTGDALFAINTMSKANGGGFAIQNNYGFFGYSDGGTTQTYFIDASTGNITLTGSLSLGQSATAVATATSGTIATANIGVSRVSPTGAVTGIILASGTIAGQTVTVVNEAALANTITFNTTPATSKVATSGSEPPIVGGTARTFTWDSSTSLWYPELLIPVVSATAVAVATSGTITTAGLDVSRVSPSGAVTSVVLGAGTYNGQTVTVINESAFSVTFATAATSNVADGTSDVIAATNARIFKWDTSTSRWYPCK